MNGKVCLELSRPRSGVSGRGKVSCRGHMRVLVIEDDTSVAELVRRALVAEGIAVDLARDAASGRTLALHTDPDAILLDLNLPDASGFDLLRELRENGKVVPVLMLTGRTAMEDVIGGFNAGADDYITKPFDVRELVARVRAVTRRASQSRLEPIAWRDLGVDRLRREATAVGEKLKLTPKEFGVLETLMLTPGEVVPRQVLLENVWGFEFDPGTNVVDVQITHLRAKLKAAGSTVRIINVRGTGFRLVDRNGSD